jgi:hypothetical protein
MLDATMMTAVANAYNGFPAPNGIGMENKRTPDETEPGLKAGAANTDQNERMNTDYVELSKEALNLARLDSSQRMGGLIQINVPEGSIQNQPNPSQQPQQMQQPEQTGLSEQSQGPQQPQQSQQPQQPQQPQNINPQTIEFNNLANTPNTVQEPITGNTTNTVTSPVSGGILRESFPGALEANRRMVNEASENAVTETTNSTIAVGLTDNVAVLQTREKEQGAKELDLKKENSILNEVPKNPAPRAEGFINENKPGGGGQAAPIPEATIVPDYPKSKEQTLLQQVGSQIAQTMPPARAISLLG